MVDVFLMLKQKISLKISYHGPFYSCINLDITIMPFWTNKTNKPTAKETFTRDQTALQLSPMNWQRVRQRVISAEPLSNNPLCSASKAIGRVVSL